MIYRLYLLGLWIAASGLFIRFWPLELIVSFTIYTLVMGLVILGGFIVWGRVSAKNVFHAILPLSLLMLLPLQSWAANNQASVDAPGFVTYTHNMLYKTSNAEEVALQAQSFKADILALQEVKLEQTEIIRQQLGFDDVFVTDCNCSANGDEIALVSRYPILSAQEVEVDVRGGRLIDAVVEVEGEELRVMVVHLPVPLKPATYATRERGFARITSLIEENKQPLVLMGDFNTTQWSPSLRGFQADNKSLTNTIREGSSYHSWCDGWLDIACLRIDHTFVHESLDILSSEVAGPAGSDHRAVVSKLRFELTEEQ